MGYRYILKDAKPSKTSQWSPNIVIPSHRRVVFYRYRCARVECDEEYIGEYARTFVDVQGTS